jgi:hypothetical protein
VALAAFGTSVARETLLVVRASRSIASVSLTGRCGPAGVGPKLLRPAWASTSGFEVVAGVVAPVACF